MQSFFISHPSMPDASDWFQLSAVSISAVDSNSNIETFWSYLFWLVIVGRFENSAQKLQWFNQKSPFFLSKMGQLNKNPIKILTPPEWVYMHNLKLPNSLVKFTFYTVTDSHGM